MKDTLLYACKQENGKQVENGKSDENTTPGAEQLSSPMEDLEKTEEPENTENVENAEKPNFSYEAFSMAEKDFQEISRVRVIACGSAYHAGWVLKSKLISASESVVADMIFLRIRSGRSASIILLLSESADLLIFFS